MKLKKNLKIEKINKKIPIFFYSSYNKQKRNYE